MSDRPTPETDAFSVKFRSVCGSKSWVPTDICRRFERERDKAREDATNYYARIGELEKERDEAREELAEAKREAENLAKSIYRSEYSDNDTDWELLDSVAGVISQIDNMYAGVREQRDEAREDAAHWKIEYEIVVARLRGKKHPNDNGIVAPDEIIPKLTRERDEAREALAEAWRFADQWLALADGYLKRINEIQNDIRKN